MCQKENHLLPGRGREQVTEMLESEPMDKRDSSVKDGNDHISVK